MIVDLNIHFETVKGSHNVCTSLEFFSIVRVNETSVLWTVLTQRDK